MKKCLFLLVITLLLSFPLRAQYQQDILVETLLKTDTTVLGQRIAYPLVSNPEVTLCKVTIPPGKETGWHKHTIPVFAYVLQGILTVELEGDKTNQFPVNSTFSEVRDVYHNGSNRGQEPVILLAIYMGGKGEALSIKR